MPSMIRTPELHTIKISDNLFKHYVDLVAKKMIPYQWDVLNGKGECVNSYCINNFKIAAGELADEHRGVVFGDTDAYKWLEAVAFCTMNGEKKFIPIADELIELIGRAQQADGYLNTYYTVVHPEQRWKNLREGHELYSAGHLFEAAVAYYQATGKEKLLHIACKFADLICEVFGPEENQCKGYPGHQLVELALVKLWRVTGKEKYLQLASFFISERGGTPNYFVEEMQREDFQSIFPELADYDPAYSQSHVPPIQQETAEGHAVRAMYMYSAMADLAQAYKDEGLKTACHKLWENVTTKRMYITGGIGSSGLLERFTTDYDLPNDRMYCESCASIGIMMFGQRMAALYREASYYEVVERALYNTVLAGISAEGDRYFYVNPLEVWPDNCLEHTTIHYVKPVRQPWFDVACCPPNISRTLASLGQYICAVDDKSLYINLFISSELELTVNENPVKIKMENSLMQGGKLKLTICNNGKKAITVRIRIPSWLEKPVFYSSKEEIHPAVENGYAVLAVNRDGEQSFLLSGEVPAKLMAANINVRADVGKVALIKGPFVYCLEEKDNGSNLAALRIGTDAEIQEAPLQESLPGDIPALKVKGQRVTATTKDSNLLYGEPGFRVEEQELTAIPYCLWGNRGSGEMRVFVDAAY